MKTMNCYNLRRLAAAVICALGVQPSHAIQIYQDYDIFTEKTEDGIPLKYMIYTEINEEEAGMDEFGHIYKRDTTVVCYVMPDETYKYGAIGRVKIPEEVHGQPVEYIYEKAFQGCSLITEVVIPKSVKRLSYMAFYGCRNISALTLPEGLEVIGVSTFEGCEKIETVTFPLTLKKIDQHAFYGCSSLRNLVNLDFSIEFGLSPFGGCPLTDFDYSTVRGTFPPFLAGNEDITSIVVPEGVTALSNNAFRGCSGLKSVSLPGSLTKVGGGAFDGCTSLEQIDGLDLSVTSLGQNVFNGCASLKSINFSGATGIIGDYVFYGWEGLESASLPEGVTAIGKETFKNCSRLAAIDLPGTLETVGEGAFAGCASLKKCTVPNLAAGLFNACAALEEVTVTGSQQMIPSAFQNCKSLKSVTLPRAATVIGDYAFVGCSSLQTIDIPWSVKAIMRGAFYDCTSLKEVALPLALVVLEDQAFAGCTGLKAVYSKMAVPMAISANCFSAETKAGATLYVPAGTRQLYEAANGWDFASIVEMDEEQGIAGVEDGKMKSESVYDLQGRRMDSTIFNSQSPIHKNGIYIRDGKKYVK